MNKNIFTCLLLIFCFHISEAQTKLDTIGLNRLNGGIKALSFDPDLRHANWGFCLMDPKNGRVISEFESDRSLNPASCMKIITTLSALNILGANYTYTTTIEYDGTVSHDSILTGNLYIHGSGDPSLGSLRIDSLLSFDSLLTSWAIEIHKRGIKKITGNIIADASAFENYATPGSWNWDDIGQYYGAGPYGLNINENAYTLFYSTTSSKSKIDSIVPFIDSMEIFNDVVVGGSGDEAYIYGAPGSYSRYVTGSIPANKKGYAVDGSMPDPPLFLAQQFRNKLNEEGVIVENDATTVYAMEREKLKVNTARFPLIKYVSPPLSDIIFHTNQKSVNLYAEALLKTIGLEQLQEGSREAGIKAVKNYWTETGLDLNGFNMDDGCGLSRLDVLTTKQMCNILVYEMKQDNFAVFENSLPVAGESGTLKTIADNTSAQGKVFAKSGSMYKVRAYSGYVMTKSGELLAFSVIANNYTCGTAEIKNKMEKLMVWMVGL